MCKVKNLLNNLQVYRKRKKPFELYIIFTSRGWTDARRQISTKSHNFSSVILARAISEKMPPCECACVQNVKQLFLLYLGTLSILVELAHWTICHWNLNKFLLGRVKVPTISALCTYPLSFSWHLHTLHFQSLEKRSDKGWSVSSWILMTPQDKSHSKIW